jgi:hypothetical protein
LRLFPSLTLCAFASELDAWTPRILSCSSIRSILSLAVFDSTIAGERVDVRCLAWLRWRVPLFVSFGWRVGWVREGKEQIAERGLLEGVCARRWDSQDLEWSVC